ncbi:MAG TPA: (Fe-S)-binding protein [Candidatus Deferrimicrobiaceae bacterium]|jgi:Fe-S oxidoreductase/nitrate reductase gamma subunit
MTGIGREIFWGVSAWAPGVMYALFGIVLLLSGWGMTRRGRAWRSGRPERENRFDDIPGRLLSLFRDAFCQARTLERFPGGLFHFLIYAGFLVLTIATLLVAVQHDLGYRILDGPFYVGFKIFADGFGLLMLLGCGAALSRRIFAPSPGQLHGVGEYAPLVFLIAVGATGFLVEGLRLSATQPAYAGASFVACRVSPLLSFLGDFEMQTAAHNAAWWAHLLLAFAFLASLPFSKMTHVATGPFSIFLRTARPAGALQSVPKIEEEERPGVLAVRDFSWKQLLSADACTRCGRCQDECPAFAADMPLSPRDVVLKTAASLHGGRFASPLPESGVPVSGGNAFAHDVLTPPTIWSCTTCRACVRACPVSIEHVDMIVDVRRGFVSESKIPDSVRVALRKTTDSGNPWGLPQADRMAWADGLDVRLASDGKPFEFLYWVGCAAAYDPRNRKVARSIATLLARAGVDFAVLGTEETCCGEAARRLGDEGLFQLGTVEAVREVFAKYGVRKIVTGCPHCFNTFRNEYPALGVQVEVVHHSQLLATLLASGRLAPRLPQPGTVAFHDSCYLGRCNGLFDEPRTSLASIPGLSVAETEKRRERSFCCGAGGGAMWLDLPGRRINHLRFDQLRATGARAFATACPYCLTMLEDAVSFHALEKTFDVRDISEYLAESMIPASERNGLGAILQMP